MERVANNSTGVCLDIKECAARLGVGLSTMRRLVREDGFPVVRFGRRLVIPEIEFGAWLTRRMEGCEK